jgi:hypothetical protein
MLHAILPDAELLLAILLADVDRLAHRRCPEYTCIGDHFQTGRREWVRGCVARGGSGSASPLCACLVSLVVNAIFPLTLAIYENVGSLAVCA